MKFLRLLFPVVGAALMWVAVPAYAGFVSGASIGSNSFSTATLQPPTSVSASSYCDGSGSAEVTLDWTVTTSAFADGYDIYQSLSEGGTYTKMKHVLGGATTTQIMQGLSTNTTYFFFVQSTVTNWTSVNSNLAQATTPATCP